MAEQKVGKVSHWYDQIEVAVIKLEASLKVGDQIKVRRGEEEFDDEVASMQINHEEVKSGKKGDEVAVKLSKKAKEGAEVFLLK